MLKFTLSQFSTANGLSQREQEVLEELLRRECSVKDIAKSLGLSPNTVSNHFKRIFDKTHTESRSELLTAFIEFIFNRTPECPRFHRRIVLAVIDDEHELCELICQFFRRKGFTAHPLTNPKAARDALNVIRPDAVIIDIEMPVTDGNALLDSIREMHPYAPPVMFMTTRAPQSPIDAMDRGALGIVEKPLDLDDLYSMILRHVLHYREERLAHAPVGPNGQALQVAKSIEIPFRHLGHGGAFLPLQSLQQAGLTNSNELTRGRLLAARLRVIGNDMLPELTIQGEIAWVRTQAEPGLEPGAGVVFIDLSDDDRETIHAFARTHRVRSFVPRGAAD